MKRTALLVVLLAIVASLFALPASAKSSGPTMAQFNALKSKITGLQGQVRSLQGQLSCFGDVYAVTSWGDPINASEGYLWGGADGNTYVTSALDWVYDTSGMQGGTDYIWMASYRDECVNYSGRSSARGLAASEAPVALPRAGQLEDRLRAWAAH